MKEKEWSPAERRDPRITDAQRRFLDVSVIARDEATRIAGCLEGILESGFLPVDVHVIVDARTSDRTEAIAREIVPRVRVVCGERGALRNAAIEAVSKPFCLFIDADMQAPARYVRELLDVVLSDGAIAIVAGAQWATATLLSRLECQYLNYRSAVPSGGALYRVDAVRQVGYFDPGLNVGEDAELLERLTSAGWKKHWSGKVHIRHEYVASVTEWLHKMRHGSGAGPRLRNLTRLVLSFPMGLHVAWRQRNAHLLWYVPARFLVAALGPGSRSPYVPLPTRSTPTV